MGTPDVKSCFKREDGRLEVHANVEFWWQNHDLEHEAALGKGLPVKFTNRQQLHDTEAEIRPALTIPPGASDNTAQKDPLLVVMVFDAPPEVAGSITGKMLMDEGMKIERRRESPG